MKIPDTEEAWKRLQKAQATTQKVWESLTRWASWSAKAPVMVLYSMRDGLACLLIGVLLCTLFPAHPFWFPTTLMMLGVVNGMVSVRRKELSVERASGRIKAILRERRVALALLASGDTKGRQMTNDAYFAFLEDVKTGSIEIETFAEAMPQIVRKTNPDASRCG